MPTPTTSPDSARQALALLLIAAETTPLKWRSISWAERMAFEEKMAEHVRYINKKRGFCL